MESQDQIKVLEKHIRKMDIEKLAFQARSNASNAAAKELERFLDLVPEEVRDELHKELNLWIDEAAREAKRFKEQEEELNVLSQSFVLKLAQLT